MCLHPNQATLIVGDQSGTVHVWDLTTDYNEQLVSTCRMFVILLIVYRYLSQKSPYIAFILTLMVPT